MIRSILLKIILLIVLSGYLQAQHEYNFGQKGGMIPKGTFQIYLRTNDEFTGFSTLLFGFRYGAFNKFQFAIEGGLGVNTYIIGLLTFTKLYESRSRTIFIGMRTRTGFKHQNTHIELGNAILDDKRTGFYIATDFTTAFRLGKEKRHVLYYSIYPMFDIDIKGNPLEIYFSPIHIGYEFAFKSNPKWTFAIESGYFFPLNEVPDTSWFNFPNLANIGFYHTFLK